jgi:2-amino-4-hydroxy-6-hydroxymethyldihydropteridine diphosphokinase
VRQARWGPRTLDCDIVLYGAHAVREPDLVIPHPELPNRPFWQRELEELHVGLPV